MLYEVPPSQSVHFAELESEQPDSESVTQKFFKGTKETMFIRSQPLQYPLLCATNFIFKYQEELIIDEMEPSNLNKDFNDQTRNPKLKSRHYKCPKNNKSMSLKRTWGCKYLGKSMYFNYCPLLVA